MVATDGITVSGVTRIPSSLFRLIDQLVPVSLVAAQLFPYCSLTFLSLCLLSLPCLSIFSPQSFLQL